MCVKNALLITAIALLIVAIVLIIVFLPKYNSDCPLGKDHIIPPSAEPIDPSIGYSKAIIKIGNQEYQAFFTEWDLQIHTSETGLACRKVRIFTMTNEYVQEYEERRNMQILANEWNMDGISYTETIYILLDSQGNELERITKTGNFKKQSQIKTPSVKLRVLCF